MTGETNWTPYTVPELAGILDDDLTSAWEQVGAWFRADAMLDDAAATLAEARSGLAAVWPPESSPAAQTFFQVVDAFTDSMQRTALAANTNANALSRVLENQTDTKSKVDSLHSTWTVTQKLVSMDPGEFPSPSQWQSSLNTEAQQHMTAADNVINEYASTLVVPPVIPVPGWIDPVTVIPGSDGTPTTSAGGGSTSTGSPSGGIPMPTVGGGGPPAGSGPPLTGVPILTGGGSPPVAGGPGLPAPGPGLPGPGAPGVPIPVMPGPPGSSGTGGRPTPVKPRIDGGFAPSEPRIGGGRPGEPLPEAGVSGRATGGGFAASEGGLGPSLGAPTSGGPIAASGRGLGAAAGDESLRGGHVLGPDGTLRPGGRAAFPGSDVHGAGSSVGPGVADGTLRPSAASRPGYVDAPGATLAPDERATLAPGEPPGRTGASAAPMTGGVDGSGRRRGRRSLADVGWAMPAGGPSVLVPASEHDVHDPGPGVIGIDR